MNKEFADLKMPAEADFDKGVLMSWGIWLYQGFVSLGALSGEVENPQKYGTHDFYTHSRTHALTQARTHPRTHAPTRTHTTTNKQAHTHMHAYTI